MKIPNLFLLLFSSLLVSLTAQAALPTVSNPAASPPATTPTSAAGTPAPTSQGAVTVDVTPEAVLSQPVHVNFARWSVGSQIVVPSPTGGLQSLSFADRAQSPLSNLIDDDPTTTCTLGPAPAFLIVDLRRLQVIDRVSFYSLTAAGTAEVFYSDVMPDALDSPKWKSADVRVDFPANLPTGIPLQPIGARYVMVKMTFTKPGSIDSLAIFGMTTVGEQAVAPEQPQISGTKPKPNSKSVDFDFGPSAYGSRVTHVSGGNVDKAQQAIDGDPSTGVALGKDKAQNNLLVVDLGTNREIDKLSLLFASKQPGTFEFYMLGELPESLQTAGTGDAPADASGAKPADAPAAKAPTSWLPANPLLGSPVASAGRLASALVFARIAASTEGTMQVASLPPDFFDKYKPNAIEKVIGNETRLNVRFDKLQCRYVIVRWIPAAGGNADLTKITNPDDDGQVSNVFEINIIGSVPDDAYGKYMQAMDAMLSSFPSTPETTPGTPTSTPGGLSPGPPSPPDPPPVSP